jgi:UDP:flavonoid glycosyltransferase YjiC (YdhE family)
MHFEAETPTKQPIAHHAGSVAIICFLPDFGHLQPLLRIADALAQRGFQIKCYVPDECGPLMRRFSFDFVSFENSHLSEQSEPLERLFRKGLFANVVGSYAHYLFCYPGVAEAALGSVSLLRREIVRQRPDVIVCDGYLFEEWLHRIAASLDVPLILDRANGSLAYNQRLFVRVYGATAASPRVQRAVELAIGAMSRLCPLYYRARYLGTWRRLRTMRRAARSALDAAFPLEAGARVRAQSIVIGTAAIERKWLPERLRMDGADWPEFAPIRFRSRASLSRELAAWIAAEPENPIVYVSFGSRVELHRSFVAAIHEGLRAVRARILWSAPAALRTTLAGLSDAPNIRIESFVPQAEILEIPTVRCFITHGGTSSMLEALFAGIPMLCIPFFADQGYNSANVEHLRVGRRLWRRRVSARSVAAAVSDLLADRSYADAALRIRNDLVGSDGGGSIARHIADVIRSDRTDARTP